MFKDVGKDEGLAIGNLHIYVLLQLRTIVRHLGRDGI